jgi:hypothetical protein
MSEDVCPMCGALLPNAGECRSCGGRASPCSTDEARKFNWRRVAIAAIVAIVALFVFALATLTPNIRL